MAKIHPDGWQAIEVTGAARRKIETLRLLAKALPDDYTVFHGVHWTNLSQGMSVYGEIDFVVMNRSGELLLIEQQSGFLEEGPDGLAKRHAGRNWNIRAEVTRTLHAFQTKLAQRLDGEAVRLEYLLYCPDYTVKHPVSAGLVPERIVDHARHDKLIPIIESILPAGATGARTHAVSRFLNDTLQLEPDVGALMGEARSLVTRVAGGLAHWGRKLRFSPFRLRVTGTAGCGKTQLALAEYADAIERGGRPLYLCYNRPLADHMQRIVPPGGRVQTFHGLCDRLLRDADEAIDYSQPGAFDETVRRAAALPVPESMRFDTVIVDEGQDFDPAWRAQIFRMGTDDARLLWLEDPMQNLYDRPPFDEPGWVQIEANTNYRCPRPVVRMLQGFLPEAEEIEAGSPFEGAQVDVLVYQDAESLRNAVKQAIRMCYSEGFRKSDLALVSFRGQGQSELMSLDKLGPHSLRRFTGRYDLLGHPEYTEGEVLLETVYRFKGQAAPAVIFAEIDFDAVDDKNMRKLFVGATRCMMKLVLVVSERAARQLDDALGPTVTVVPAAGANV